MRRDANEKMFFLWRAWTKLSFCGRMFPVAEHRYVVAVPLTALVQKKKTGANSCQADSNAAFGEAYSILESDCTTVGKVFIGLNTPDKTIGSCDSVRDIRPLIFQVFIRICNMVTITGLISLGPHGRMENEHKTQHC